MKTLSDEELDNIPELMKEIVLLDRRIEELFSQPALNLFELTECINTRSRLTDAAAKNFHPRRTTYRDM